MSIAEPLQLAELGYRVFPLAAGGKVPLVNAWVEHASNKAEQIELWLSHYQHANWGIATDGLIVIDTDPGAEGWPNDEQQARELASTPVIAITPRGGRHYYFRQPEGANLRNTQNGQLAEHVDTRANGGYVAAPPSIVNDNPYKWLSGDIDTRPEDLPVVPRWVLDKLAQSARKDSSNQPNVATGPVPEGQRNGSLIRLAGAMRRVGADNENILVALKHHNATRCVPPLDCDEVETVAKSAARYAPHEVAIWLKQHEADDAYFERMPDDPGPLPAELLNVPGFIADVMAHNLAGAHKPQPALALAGALTLLGALTGRKITDTQGTRTNLYCVGVVGTSRGKERAREVNKEILYNAGLLQMVGPESIGSAQGIVTAVAACPSILLQLDELGKYLQTIKDSRESFQTNIMPVLMRLFTSSASVFIGDAVVDAKRVQTIYNPNACIYGTTTFEAFYNGLSLSSLQDGFLSRVLIFEGDQKAKKRHTGKPPMPANIVEQAKYWGQLQTGGNLSGANPSPIIVEATAPARRIMYEFDSVAEFEEAKLGDPLGCVWPRAVEKANKLALLYACSENSQSPIVTDAAALWAVEIVTHLTQQLAFQAARRISENRIDGNVKRVGRLVEDAGPKGLTKTAMTNLTGWCTGREREEYLNTLIEGGQIVTQAVEHGPGSRGGRPGMIFIHRRHAASVDESAAV